MNCNGGSFWLFYNAIGAVAQCPNNWGVGSVFPTLENTYFICFLFETIFEQYQTPNPRSKENSMKKKMAPIETLLPGNFSCSMKKIFRNTFSSAILVITDC